MQPKLTGTRTLADWLAQPEGHRLELVNGHFVGKASPSSEHGVTQTRVGIQVGGPFMRRTGGSKPGGWWIATEVDILVGNDLFRPDLIGWRRAPVRELVLEGGVPVHATVARPIEWSPACSTLESLSLISGQVELVLEPGL